jgi:hypothetical protein
MRYHRWRKHGRDRLYITADDGMKLGYLDLADRDTPHIDAPARAAQFHAGIERWRQLGRPDDYTDPTLTGIPAKKPQRVALRRTHAAAPAPAVTTPTTPPTPAGGWDDLALHQPGAGIAEIAAAHRKAHPVKTRLDRLRVKHTDAQAWAKGAAGEETTGQALQRLASGEHGHRWLILHSLTVNAYGGDIDHLLIGTAGVFTINTKHHAAKTVHVGRDTLTVDGYDHYDYIQHANNEAHRAQTVLEAAGIQVDVWPVISFVGADVVGEQHLHRVLCIDVNRLTIVMTNYANTHHNLDDATITYIHGIARRSTTWNSE